MTDHFMEDSLEMRKQVKANIWPTTILKKYHPRPNYDAHPEKAFTRLFFESPALFDVISGFFKRDSSPHLDEGFLSFVSLELDLLPRELMMTAASTMKSRRGHSEEVNHIDLAWLVKQATEGMWQGIRKAMDAKKNTSPRPDWLTEPDYEGEFDSPSIWSSSMAHAISRINIEFSFDPNEIFDTAYLLAMMPAMYGRCYIQSCLDGLVIAGMLSKGYDEQFVQ